MISAFNQHIQAKYADADYLLRHKALAMAWVCVLSILMVSALLLHNLKFGAGNSGLYLTSNVLVLLALVFAFEQIRRGKFSRTIDGLLVLVTAIHLINGLRFILAGLIQEFYAGSAFSASTLIVISAIFARRKVFMLISLAELSALLCYIHVPSPGAPALLTEYYGHASIVSFLATGITCGVAWAFVSIVDRALARVQQELDTNRELQVSLEHKVLERTRDLDAARHAAEAANRAKSAFLANMSHENRTPLHGILGMTDLMQGEEHSREQDERMRTISDSGRHLLGLIQDILDYSKIEAGGDDLLRPHPLELAPFFKAIVEPMRILAQAKGLELRLELASDLPTHVSGDGMRVRQVLTNLLANAIKFTDAGEVTLAVEYRNELDALVCAVRDTGIGIEEGDQTRIFERFRQAAGHGTEKFGGSGLGLAISRMLCEAMAGSLSVVSALGGGSCFTALMRLPACAGVAALSPDAIREENMDWSGDRILLVDDNATNRKVALGILKRIGVETVVAEDGPQALDKLRSQAFSLVLMDCQMPGMDGLEVTRVLRGWSDSADACMCAAAKVPVIAVTASAQDETRDECIEAGMDDLLVKPFRSEDLRAMLGRWKGRVHRSWVIAAG